MDQGTDRALVLARDSNAPGTPAQEELHAALEEARGQVEASLVEIRDIVRQRTDWRAAVRQHPERCVAIAFGLGFLWGLR